MDCDSRRDPPVAAPPESATVPGGVSAPPSSASTVVFFAASSSFFSSGHRCSASSRIIVTEGIDDTFVAKLAEAAKAIKVGDSRADGVQMGPIASQEQLDIARDAVAKAKAEGKYKGRKPTARAKADEVHALKAQGIGATAIAEQMKIGRASVYRIFGDGQSGVA